MKVDDQANDMQAQPEVHAIGFAVAQGHHGVKQVILEFTRQGGAFIADLYFPGPLGRPQL